MSNEETAVQYTLGAGSVEALPAGIKISKIRAGNRPGENVSDSGIKI